MENGTDVMCPICRDFLIQPRIYECGHTICEPCMIKSDRAAKDENQSTFTIPKYKCPLCRKETLLAWHLRPVNHNLLEIFSRNSDYSQAMDKYRKEKEDEIEEDDIDFPDEMNLASVVNRKRKEKCEYLYQKIRPVLFAAALEGKPYITITTDTADIQCVADMLAKKIFNNHCIWKMQSNARECQIDFIPSTRSFQAEYVNRRYRQQNSDNDSDNERDDDIEVDTDEIIRPIMRHMGGIIRTNLSTRPRNVR